MDSFARFIPGGTSLDPATVRAEALAARPFPEWASPDEIAAVGRQVGAERAELWSCEHRREPHHVAGLSPEEVGRRYTLTYQALPGDGDYAYVLRLTFSQTDAPDFRILKRGGDITADTVLRRDAEPAR